MNEHTPTHTQSVKYKSYPACTAVLSRLFEPGQPRGLAAFHLVLTGLLSQSMAEIVTKERACRMKSHDMTFISMSENPNKSKTPNCLFSPGQISVPSEWEKVDRKWIVNRVKLSKVIYDSHSSSFLYLLDFLLYFSTPSLAVNEERNRPNNSIAQTDQCVSRSPVAP